MLAERSSSLAENGGFLEPNIPSHVASSKERRLTTIGNIKARLSEKEARSAANLTATAVGELVRLSDSKTGVERNILRGHTDWVSSVMFSPDQKLSRIRLLRQNNSNMGLCDWTGENYFGGAHGWGHGDIVLAGAQYHSFGLS